MSPPELKAMLDSDLDPNSTTTGGTMVLIIAAADADKVKLLLDRGSQVSQREGEDTLHGIDSRGGLQLG